MPDRSRKRPRDVNSLAKLIVDEATSDDRQADALPAKNPAAVELGRMGGLKGGRARANALTAEQRREIAQRAAAARWKKVDDLPK